MLPAGPTNIQIVKPHSTPIGRVLKRTSFDPSLHSCFNSKCERKKTCECYKHGETVITFFVGIRANIYHYRISADAPFGGAIDRMTMEERAKAAAGNYCEFLFVRKDVVYERASVIENRIVKAYFLWPISAILNSLFGKDRSFFGRCQNIQENNDKLLIPYRHLFEMKEVYD